jgi:hypothetical protein
LWQAAAVEWRTGHGDAHGQVEVAVASPPPFVIR